MTVYVLGAGASAHAGYPLASSLGTKLAAWVKKALGPAHSLRQALGQIEDAYSGQLGDFEAILADLIVGGSRSRFAGLPTPARAQLVGEIQEAVVEYFNSIRAAPAPLYDELAARIRRGDLVISYNYDLAVERALRAVGLWDITTGYGFAVGEGGGTSPVEVLKLHGSTNWRGLLFGGGGASLGDRPVLLFRADQEYLGYRGLTDPNCANMKRATSLPAVILPAPTKRFYLDTTYGREWKPFWDGLWGRAERALQHARELVIIGYSMPTADTRARELLLDRTDKGARLTICSGAVTANLQRDFAARGFGGIQRVDPPTFCGWLDRVAGD